MSIRIQGVVQARQQLQAIEDFLNSRRSMEGIVEDIAEMIQKKTGKGHDYMNRNFKSYTEAYKKRRAKLGLPTKPDLTVTGKMLRAIKTAVLGPRHGRVFVQGRNHGKIRTDMLAQIHNTGTGKQPQREFMNVSKSAIKDLTKKHYDDPILEIVRRYR